MANNADKVIEIARKELGKTDGTKYGRWYEANVDKDAYNYDFGAGGVPWCAMFASWTLDRAGVKCAGLPGAYCPTMLAVARERGACVGVDKAAKGDVVYFDWDGGVADHVGICIENHPAERWMLTIEGNTDEGVVREKRREYGTIEGCVRPEYVKAVKKSIANAVKKVAAKKPAKKLYGIDVSSNQPEGIVSMVPNDFAIVKMSGNPQRDGEGNPLRWDYVNEFAKRQCADAMKKHGRLGLYHFTWGKSAETEAEFFIKQVKKLGYLGKAVLVIDYEAQALALGRDWVRQFAKRVEKLAGYKPVIYASGGVITGQDLISLGYPIWCANYYRSYAPIYGYDTSGCKIWGGCEKSVLWQYTSQGFLDGYDGALDCNVFYGTKEDWMALASKHDPKWPDGTYVVAIQKVGIRSRRSTASTLCCTAAKGARLKLRDLKPNKAGNVWGQVASGDHSGRYVMVYSAAKKVNRLKLEHG